VGLLKNDISSASVADETLALAEPGDTLFEGLYWAIVALLRLVLSVVLLAARQALVGDLHRIRNKEQEFNFNGYRSPRFRSTIQIINIEKQHQGDFWMKVYNHCIGNNLFIYIQNTN
jgi:hypothetical protein